jgi:hypothetical protein
MSFPYIVGGDFISIVVDNQPYNINTSHPFYDGIKKALKAKDWDFIRQNINVSRKITASVGGFEVDEEGNVYHKGAQVHSAITSKILDMFKDGYDILPLLKFMERMESNPSKDSVGELYHFLEASGMPITEDGHILAYKSIRADWKDVYTGTIDNSIGAVVKMAREDVTANRTITCAPGLHFCSLKYLRDMNWGGCENVVIVKIDPRDIVSVPNDYKDTKGRCCQYTVVGQVKDFAQATNNANTDLLRNQQVFTDEEVASRFNGVQVVEADVDEVVPVEVVDIAPQVSQPVDILVQAAQVAKAAPAQPMPKRDNFGRFLKKNQTVVDDTPPKMPKRDKSGKFLPKKTPTKK